MEKIKVENIKDINLKGKVIVFPTDTVYGLGAMINDKEGIDKIYQIKQRNYSKPLSILVSNKDVSPYIYDNKKVVDLIDKYWPGALTIIAKKKDIVSDYITSGLNTVGLRMPNNEISLKIINHFGPLATTSVNISGDEPLNDINEIEEYFGDVVDYIVIDKTKFSKVSSTVVQCVDDGYKVIRNGDIKL